MNVASNIENTKYKKDKDRKKDRGKTKLKSMARFFATMYKLLLWSLHRVRVTYILQLTYNLHFHVHFTHALFTFLFRKCIYGNIN